MVSLDKAIVAHLEYKGERFEVLVDPDLAYPIKTGKAPYTPNLLAAEEVFKNARTGERHKAEDIKKAFGTNDIHEITRQILAKGEVQLTTEQRKKMLEEKTRKIIAILARETVDPRTGAPHPPARIEKAMEEAKVHVDAFKEPEQQIEEVLKGLRLILPMKFEKVKIACRVPPEFAAKSYGTLKEYHITQEEWQKDGSLIVVVEMPAGLQGEFYDRVNKMTGGNVQTKIVK